MMWAVLMRATAVVTCCAIGVSCTPADPLKKFSGPAQGATYNISYWSEQPVDQAALQQQITAELERIDLAMSNYRPDSTIEKFNQLPSTEPVEVGTEIVQLVAQARSISSQSQGCYDLTVKPLFAGSEPRLNGANDELRYPVPANSFGWLGMQTYGGRFSRGPNSWLTTLPMLGNCSAGLGR